MAAATLEERMAAMETEMARIKQQLAVQQPLTDIPWWERRFGAFKDDPLYEEAMRLGAEYRKSQPAPADDNVSA